jgi:hypothetical protein
MTNRITARITHAIEPGKTLDTLDMDNVLMHVAFGNVAFDGESGIMLNSWPVLALLSETIVAAHNVVFYKRDRMVSFEDFGSFIVEPVGSDISLTWGASQIRFAPIELTEALGDCLVSVLAEMNATAPDVLFKTELLWKHFELALASSSLFDGSPRSGQP